MTALSAVSAARPAALAKRAQDRPKAAPTGSSEDQQIGDDAGSAPAEVVVKTIVEAPAADLGWLSWLDGPPPAVVRRESLSPIDLSVIAEFPDPPDKPTLVDDVAAPGPWAVWCGARGIKSCLVVPVLMPGKVIGSIGLASSAPKAFGTADLRQLLLISS